MHSLLFVYRLPGKPAKATSKNAAALCRWRCAEYDMRYAMRYAVCNTICVLQENAPGSHGTFSFICFETSQWIFSGVWGCKQLVPKMGLCLCDGFCCLVVILLKLRTQILPAHCCLHRSSDADRFCENRNNLFMWPVRNPSRFALINATNGNN